MISFVVWPLCCCKQDNEKKVKKCSCKLPTVGSLLMMIPHIAVGTAVVLRLLEPTADLCELQIGCLSAANFCGWLTMVNYLMLERRVGPFFIMVSEMIARDFVRFIVIPLTILPAFAITFNTCVLPFCLSHSVTSLAPC